MIRIEVQNGFITNSSSTIYVKVVFNATVDKFIRWIKDRLTEEDEYLKRYIGEFNWDDVDEVRYGLEDVLNQKSFFGIENGKLRGEDLITYIGSSDEGSPCINILNALDIFIKENNLDHVSKSETY